MLTGLITAGEGREGTGDGREGRVGPRSVAAKACSASHPAPGPRPQPTSMGLPGRKGKLDSRSSSPQDPSLLLLHTMVLTSPCASKRGLKCRHRLLPSLPRFRAKLRGAGTTETFAADRSPPSDCPVQATSSGTH